MKDSFIDILRRPDDIKIQTEASPLRFEERNTANPVDAEVRFETADDCMKVYLMPSNEAVKRIRLRFRGDMSGVSSVLGDVWERARPDDLLWSAMLPHKELHWYFHTYDGEYLHSYGVRTGANCFAIWQCDPKGITLYLDVRSGSGGVRIKELLMCAEIVSRRGRDGETPYKAACEFCRLMCPAPNLPKQNVYGLNNWYWAYGNTDHNTFIGEAKYLAQLTEGCKARPYMVMDDGWQPFHTKGYNGGPWASCNERFIGMDEAAAQVKAAGCRPGIWFRPLRSMGHIPPEAVYATPFTGAGIVMDPTHPYTVERVAEDVRRIAGWGYELIKHDFSTFDLFNIWPRDDMGLKFRDDSLTNAQVLKKLYSTIQENAGGAVVIGCNTVGHLTAGIHQVQRIGDDTSGRMYELTRRDGIHSMMRLPQNGALSQIDPDCAAFTHRVSHSVNLDFMEAMAMTGCTVFASITPRILSARDEQRASDILKLAADITPDEYAVPLDWHHTSAPSEYLFKGKEYRFDWYAEYDGARSFFTWFD